MIQIETNRFCFLIDQLATDISNCLKHKEHVSYLSTKERLARINMLVLADKESAWLYRLKLDNALTKLFESNLLVFDT